MHFDMNADRIKLVQSINAFNSTDDISIQNKTILKLLDVKLGESVLDVGCGLGSLCKMISDIVGPTGNVTGVDISQLMISLAEDSNLYQWLTFRQGNAMDLDIEDSTIDKLCCVQLAEYLPNVNSFLSNAYRILKNNGRIIVVTTDWNSLIWSHWQKDYTPKWRSHCSDPILHSTLKNKLIQTGFKSIYFENYNIRNSEYSQLSYSYWLSCVIMEYMVAKNYFSQEERIKWFRALINANESGEYKFSLNRYIFLATK